MANEVDLLMDLDPLELTKDDAAIDKIIAHYRKLRAEGGKPKKEQGPKPTVDLLGLVKGMVKAVAPVGAGIRRRV